MPKYFHFHVANDDRIHFDGMLASERCGHRHANGDICKKRTIMSLDRCWIHVRIDYHVKIADSSIPNAGKGLFAFDNTAPDNNNNIVFKKNECLFSYLGEVITRDTLDERYGQPDAEQHTAPYAIELTKKSQEYEDAALHRGIGSLINHGTTSQANCRFSITKNNRIVIRATKDIRNGKELRINYRGASHNKSQYRINEHGVSTSTNNRKYTAGAI